MARKDEILRSFLAHDLIKNQYKITEEELPTTVSAALKSKKPIIRAIAMFIDAIEGDTTDKTLREQLINYLNTTAS